MDEKELLNRIQNSAERIVIPQSLEPENIRAKLKDKSKMSGMIKLVEMAAVICILIFGGMFMDRNMFRVHYANTTEIAEENAMLEKEEVVMQEAEILMSGNMESESIADRNIQKTWKERIREAKLYKLIESFINSISQRIKGS